MAVTVKKSIVVYKSGRAPGSVPVLILLEIPKGAKVWRSITPENAGKNRASRAKVLSIESVDGLKRFEKATARKGFVYQVGKTVKPIRPFDVHDNECASGIHFYLRRREAMEWCNARVSDGTDTQYPEYYKARREHDVAMKAKNEADSRVRYLEAKLDNARRALSQ